MTKVSRKSIWYVSLTLVLSLCLSAVAEDWPTRLHDIHRSGVTTEVLSLPLTETWTYKTVRTPDPAWTNSPAIHDYFRGLYNLKPRQNFDSSPDIAAVGTYVYFGCSKSGTVNCLNALTGKKVWTFFTEGPVRFTPTVAHGKVYFGSDDGYVYCVGATDGSLIWSERVGGEDMIWGNEHMISVWPVRSSVLVDSSDVFWAAGIFPEEGMYLCKRNATDGTGGWTVTPALPPQGLLLATAGTLFVTSGKTYPYAYSRSSGAVQGTVPANISPDPGSRDGGSWALVTPDENDFWTGPSVQNSTLQVNAGTRVYIASVAGANRIIADLTYAYYNTDTQIFKINRSNRSVVWSVNYVYPYSIIKAGATIFAGGDGEIAAFDNSGTRVWTAPVNGKAYGLAVANGRLYASTDTGYIHCFNATIPSITNVQGASNVTVNSADLNGYLESAGISSTTVSVHWGTTDGGTNPAVWENTQSLGIKSVGPLSVPVAGLTEPVLYYYRFQATNSYGASWSPASAVFITGEVTILATDPEASEDGLDPGTFTVYRPSETTGGALEVKYNLAGTAESGSDYVALSGSVVIAEGSTSATIDVLPIGNIVLIEPNETVIVTLSSGGYVIGDPEEAVVTISDFSGSVSTVAFDDFSSGDETGGTGWGTDWVDYFGGAILINVSTADPFNENLSAQYRSTFVYDWNAAETEPAYVKRTLATSLLPSTTPEVWIGIYIRPTDLNDDGWQFGFEVGEGSGAQVGLMHGDNNDYIRLADGGAVGATGDGTSQFTLDQETLLVLRLYKNDPGDTVYSLGDLYADLDGTDGRYNNEVAIVTGYGLSVSDVSVIQLYSAGFATDWDYVAVGTTKESVIYQLP